uniref:EF-hand domain-containing protein n=2 Tax=Rhizochromulina marina TaxID=1034831 RepID=A0A7S2ST25_9STRA
MAAVSSTSSPASCVDPKDQEDAQHGDAAVVSPPSVVALQTPKGQGGVGGGGNADGSTPQVAAGEAEQHRGGLVVDEALASHQQASSGQQDNPEQKQEVAEEPGAEATTRRESGGEEETSEAGQGAQVKELGPELGASGVGEEPEPGEDADDTFGEQVPSELQMVITMQKRASIIVNELGDSDDDDVEDEEEVTPAGAEGVAAVEDRRPTSALETPPVEARESSRSLGAAEDKSSESRSEPPTSDAYHQAIDEMEVTDELLELCFRNLNDGDMEGTLNPMQLSIIVRLITSEHNLFTEMKWFSAFDTDGIGGVSMEEFKQGIRNLQSNGLAAGAGVTVPGVIDALKTYSASSSFAL